MVITESAPSAGSDSLVTGSLVEVRRRFDRAWASGFEVAALDEDGYWLRRSSDGTVLPVEFALEDVRLAHRKR